MEFSVNGEIGATPLKALRSIQQTLGVSMGPRSRRGLFGPLNRLFRTGTLVGLSDGQLLERFVRRHDEAAEAAFEVLVERHGPMVLGVCRRVLRDLHDAEDAFQATFLVLVRKAGTVRERESVAEWLHGVAVRVSAHARVASARRRQVEQRARAGAGPSPAYEAHPTDSDIEDEVERLPRELRAVVVLCYLEGLTHEQAAQRLGWPVGTVRSRLARARDRLRTRLTRRGLAPGDALTLLFSARTARLPEGWVDPVVKAAMRLAARDAAEAGLVSATVVAMTEGVLHTMFISQLKSAAAVLLATGAVVCGVGVYAYQDTRPDEKSSIPHFPAAKVAPAPNSSDPLDADADADIQRFNVELMDSYAAKIEQLVKRARENQAGGKFEEAVLDLRRIEFLTGEWGKYLTKGQWSVKDGFPQRDRLGKAAPPPTKGADDPVFKGFFSGEAAPPPTKGADGPVFKEFFSEKAAPPPMKDADRGETRQRESLKSEVVAPPPTKGADGPDFKDIRSDPSRSSYDSPTKKAGRRPSASDRRLDELERKVELLLHTLEKDRAEGAVGPRSSPPVLRPIEPPPPGLVGQVQKFDKRAMRVEISIGSDDGLSPDHQLFLWRHLGPAKTRKEGRQKEYLGRIRILAVHPDQAVAEVFELLPNATIERGDEVSSTGPAPRS
jgi:RNA polymerase sigma-70 factor (ECF subfamily)